MVANVKAIAPGNAVQRLQSTMDEGVGVQKGESDAVYLFKGRRDMVSRAAGPMRCGTIGSLPGFRCDGQTPCQKRSAFACYCLG
jgi:hypothetical protein